MLAVLPTLAVAQASLQVDLTAILQDPALERAAIGVFVKEMGGQVLFSQGGDKRLMPASALKVVTAGFALETLGASHRFATKGWREGRNVYLLGAADPLLTVEELTDLGARLGAERGDTVHFDDSLLGSDRVNGTWEFGDMMREDAPPVSALTVNGGFADVVIQNGQARLRPRNFGVVLKRGRTEGEPGVRREFGSWTGTVYGKLPENDDDFGTVSLPDPALCAAMILTGKAGRSTLEEAPESALKIDKRTLSDVLPAVLKRSDNHAAETILRLAGRKLGGDGSWDAALAKEAAWLKQAGASESAFRLADGSGLSRFNEITPRALVSSLERSLSQPSAGVFGSSMCRPGEGTLRNRFQGLDLRAKTGTLTGVCSLVGYIDIAGTPQTDPRLKLLPNPGESPRRILFAILFNHYEGPASGVRPIQDAIVRRLQALGSRSLQ
jgi:D-alanyl-D-alanine carboxypeptidase/D-alanyl-D-alanine-endopeptidase (penicillin-binding protein 4)